MDVPAWQTKFRCPSPEYSRGTHGGTHGCRLKVLLRELEADPSTLTRCLVHPARGLGEYTALGHSRVRPVLADRGVVLGPTPMWPSGIEAVPAVHGRSLGNGRRAGVRTPARAWWAMCVHVCASVPASLESESVSVKGRGEGGGGTRFA